MASIILGKAGRGNVSLDIPTLLRTRLLVQANSGKGKSWALRRIAELLFGKVQVIILDREGEFATLREKYGYVLVGKGGETPADPRSAAMVAQKLLELHASAVVDLYEMKDSERHRYVRLFLDALIDAPKNLWHPVVIIVDEAHSFCPEKGAGESEAADAMISLATRGRKRGFCAVFATQRLGKLRKDAAAELLNVLIGGTFIDVDRKRAAECLGIDRTGMKVFFDQVKVLDRGYFYALGTAISKERELVHIGSVETSHPDIGTKHAAEPPPPPEKVRALLPKLADLPKQAEEKAKTEAEYKATIRSLQAQLRARPVEAKTVPVADPKAITQAVRTVKTEAEKEIAVIHGDRKALLANGARLAKALLEMAEMAKKAFLERKPSLQSQYRTLPVPSISIPTKIGREIIAQRQNVRRELTRQIYDNGKSDNQTPLPKGERAVLTAVAQYQDGVQRDQITILTGFKRSTRDAYVARLKDRGYVSVNGNGITATQEGIDALGSDYEPLPTGDALLQHWLGRLPEGERRILEVLVENQGQPVQRESLEERTGFKRSTRDAYLSRLTARRLVTTVGRSQVKASDELFD